MILAHAAIASLLAGADTAVLPSNMTGLKSFFLYDFLPGANNSNITSYQDKAGFAVSGQGNFPVLYTGITNNHKGALCNGSKMFRASTNLNIIASSPAVFYVGAISLRTGATLTGNKCFFSASTATGGNARFEVKLINNQLSVVARRLDADSAYTLLPAANTGTVAAGESFLITAYWEVAARTIRLWKNDILIASNSTATTAGSLTSSTDSNNIQWGAKNGYSEHIDNSYLLGHAIGNALLTDSQITSLRQLFLKEYALS